MYSKVSAVVQNSSPDFPSPLVLDISGAAEVDMRIAVEHLQVDAKGASQLELDGSATNAVIAIAGAGKVDATFTVTTGGEAKVAAVYPYYEGTVY